jgi:hypothetical protein
MKHLAGFLLVAVLSITGIGTLRADPATPASGPTDESVCALALRWYLQMQAGKIDRSEYIPAFRAQLTGDAVEAMSHHLNEYGASPTRAEILQKRSRGNQAFYLMKLIFPRGDAASILFGLDAEEKITAIRIMSMAGD